MRNLMLACAGLALISGIVSVNLWSRLRAERQLTAGLRAEATDIGEGGSGPTLPVQPTVTAAPVAPMAQAQVGKTEPPVAQQAGDKSIGAGISQFLAEDAARLKAQYKDAEYRRATYAQERARLPQQYPGLVERLQLTPEEAGKLFDLLAEVQLEKLSANASNSFNPFSGQPEDVSAVRELMRTRQEIQRRRDESLAAILGSARHETFREYEAERPARQRVDALGQTLAAAGQPLSDAQMRPLTAVFLAEEKHQREESLQRTSEADVERQAEGNRRLLEAAQPHLSVQQLEAYRTSLDQQLARTSAAARVLRERSEAQAR